MAAEHGHVYADNKEGEKPFHIWKFEEQPTGGYTILNKEENCRIGYDEFNRVRC